MNLPASFFQIDIRCKTVRLDDRVTKFDESSEVLRRRSQPDSFHIAETRYPYLAAAKKINTVNGPHFGCCADPELLLYRVSCQR